MKLSELKTAVDNIQVQLAGDDPEIDIMYDFDKVKITDVIAAKHVWLEIGGAISEVIIKIVRK